MSCAINPQKLQLKSLGNLRRILHMLCSELKHLLTFILYLLTLILHFYSFTTSVWFTFPFFSSIFTSKGINALREFCGLSLADFCKKTFINHRHQNETSCLEKKQRTFLNLSKSTTHLQGTQKQRGGNFVRHYGARKNTGHKWTRI